MVTLPKQAMEEFKAIYLKTYRKRLSDSKANEKGLILLNLMKLVYKPIPKAYAKPTAK